MRGKGFDTFCPIGPAIVTKDEIRDPQSLPIRTIINGRTVREGNTCDMICTVPRLIAALSRHMTLRPGSLILTGAPPAHAFSPLQPGDVAVVEIDQLGSLRNPIASGHSRLH